MKRLMLDIETAPHVAHIWNLWNQNIAPKQVMATGYTMCWSAKWYDGSQIFFDSVRKSSEKHMVERVWKLLDQADAVITYNGIKFDLPTLNREFIKNGLLPPAPYRHIDLLRTVRQNFKFHSNKLDSVLKFLGMESKVCHKGHELWVECMAGDEKAWRIMEKYNKRDTKILEALYERLLPWISVHPNMGLYTDTDRPTCPNCGGTKMEKQGTRKTQTHLYQRFRCISCGKWAQDRFNCTPPEKKRTVLKGCHN